MADGINNKGTMNITNSAVAVGKNASAATTVNQAASASLDDSELRSALAELVMRLRAVAGELAGPDQGVVTEAADEVAAELTEPSPRWARIREALRRVGPAVTALVNLAADVARITEAINPLLPR